MAIPTYTQADLKESFPRGYFARGEAYFLAGRVQEAEQQGDAVVGVVQGGSETPYHCHVRIQPRPNQPHPVFVSECSCPMGGYCKHVVATLLAWLAIQRKEALPPRDVVQATTAVKAAPPMISNSSKNAPRTPTPASADEAEDLDTPENEADDKEPGVSRELASWLDALMGVASPQSAPAKHRLVYLLSARAGGLSLALCTARMLVKGGMGKPTPFRISRRFDVDYLLPMDEALLRDIEHLPAIDENTYELEGAYGAVLMQTLLTTERCYWETLQEDPLYPGEPRTASLAWEIDPSGIQHIVPSLPTPSTRLLPLEPLYYLDGAICGEIDCGLPPKLAQRLLAAPPVAPHEVEAVAAALPPELPRPQVLPFGADVMLAPQPVLRCESMQAFRLSHYTHLSWLRMGELDTISLEFDYGGLRIKADDQTQRLTRWHDGEVQHLPRNRAEEKAALASLADIGLIPLDQIDRNIRIDGIRRYAFTPDTSAKGRHTQGRHPAALWQEFIETTVPRLRAAGWLVEYAPGFHYGVIVPEGWHIELDDWDSGSGTDWFGMTLEVEIAGERRPLLPILLSVLGQYPDAASMKRLTHVLVDTDRGERLSLPVARIAPLLNTLFDLFADLRPDDTKLRLGRLDAARLEELQNAPGLRDLRWRGGEQWRELAKRFAQFGGLQEVPVPADLRAGLRPYQSQGMAWLQFLREYGFGGVLADDMGLGKTVQTLAHLLIEKAAGRMDKPTLIVAPTSLVHNWRREAERFTPTLKLLILHGVERHQRYDELAGVDIAITTYPLLARDIEMLAAQPFHFLVLDEAQQIKNPKSVTARSVRELKAEHRLCLTGTPMENHLGELWALFDFLMPGWLGDEKSFVRQWRTPIEKHGNAERRGQLSRRVAPFLLRRTKEQVATELPPKTETIQYVELDGPQRDLYETVRLAMNDKVRAEISKHGVARSQIVILEALLKLRQVCCDPRLVKLEAARNVPSAKLDALMEMISELVAEGRRILLFSQFTSMLALVQEALVKAQLEYVILTGDTRDRSTPVERFQAGQVPVFLVSLKAGGVGLNLTAADTVIHYDPWWNPAVENQATDRAYRIGQDKPVFVYKLVAKGTVEEKIVELQRKKAELTAGVLGDEGAALTALSSEDLIRLFDPIE